MAASKTIKSPAKSKAPVKGKPEVAKKVAAKAKAVAKASAKIKDVPKIGKKGPAVAASAKPRKAGPVTAATKSATKIEPNSKKSIVSVAVKKFLDRKAAAAANAISLAPAAKPAAAVAKPVAPPAKAGSAAKTVASAVAKPSQPQIAKPQAVVGMAVPAAKPQASAVAQKVAPKAAAPAVVLPLKKLPLNGKPGAPVASKAPAPLAAKPGTPIAAKPSAPVASKPAAPAATAPKPGQPQAKAPAAPVVAAQPDPKKPMKPATQRHGFRTNEYVVYPSHGVGKIVRIEEQVVAGYSLELFVIHFEHEKMTLKVPTAKAEAVGMRKLSETPIVERAMETLKGRARIKRTMWSRRAQEYEAKINSGDLVSIAEVVRDLYRAETQPEQSYSERQLFEAALDRMSREVAAVEKLDERGAVQKITEILAKSARGRKAAADEAAAEAAREQAA